MNLLTTKYGKDYWHDERQTNIISTSHISNPDYFTIAKNLFGVTEIVDMLKNKAIVPTNNITYTRCLNANSDDFIVVENKCYYCLGTPNYTKGVPSINHIVDRINSKFSFVMDECLVMNCIINSMSTDELIYRYFNSEGLFRCKKQWLTHPFTLTTFSDSFAKIVDKDINDIIVFNRKIYIN